MVMPQNYCFLSGIQKSKLDLVLLSAMTSLFVTSRVKLLAKD
jgi:hypothetical protein